MWSNAGGTLQNGLQSVYLAEVPEQMADALIALIALIGQAFYDALAELTVFPSEPDADEADVSVEGDLTATFREQLVKARRGQGVFRSNVLLSEQFANSGVSTRFRGSASFFKRLAFSSPFVRYRPFASGCVPWQPDVARNVARRGGCGRACATIVRRAMA